MTRFATLRQLAEEVGDQELEIPRPLSEAALAEVSHAMGLLNAASRKIDASQGALEACRVPFDVRPFRKLQDCLNEAFMTVAKVPLANAEAVARGKR